MPRDTFETVVDKLVEAAWKEGIAYYEADSSSTHDAHDAAIRHRKRLQRRVKEWKHD